MLDLKDATIRLFVIDILDFAEMRGGMHNKDVTLGSNVSPIFVAVQCY